MNLKDNWHYLLLPAGLLVLGVALFPAGKLLGGKQSLSESGPSVGQDSLPNGAELAADPVGMTAAGVDISDGQETQIRETVAADLSLSRTDVTVRPATAETSGTIEVFTEDVSESEVRAALRAAGLEARTIRPGVTHATKAEIVEVLNARIERSGITSERAAIDDETGQVVVEVPGENRTEATTMFERRGQVAIVAHFPANESETSYRNVTLLTVDDFEQVGVAQEGGGSTPPFVPVTIAQPAAENYAEAMQQYGYTDDEKARCNYRTDPDDPGYCLYTILDGDVVYAAGVAPGLAQAFEDGSFADDPSFRMVARNMSEAQRLERNLRTGALPTDLDVTEVKR